MTSRGNVLCGLAVAGLLCMVLVLAACGGGKTTTTVPPVPTTEAPTTTTAASTTTTLAPTTTSQAPTTTTTAAPTTTTTATPPAPAITNLTPSKGPVAGGTTVVITGTGFLGLSGTGAVTFGGTNATSYTVDSATKITAKAPAHAAGSVRVKVTTAYGVSANTAADDFTYVGPPAVASLSPATGPVAGGTSVVITGTDLTGATGVTFGGVVATFTVDSATKITAKAPAHAAGSVRVKVTTAFGVSANTAADDFTYVGAPAITGLDPTSGPTAGGTTVVITGTGFLGLSGAGAVTFGGINATSYTVDSATKITATTPAHAAGSVRVKVTSAYGVSANTAADDFTYVGAPAITGLDPTSGPTAGGTTVVITGTGLTGASSVTFGDAAATFTVDSATKITATAPAHASGSVQVKVTTTYGASADTAADDFTYVGPPAITGLDPTSGPTAGGTTVVITGTDLTGTTGVTFGGIAATFTVDSATQITATAPAHAAGQAQVELSGAGPADPDAQKYYYLYVDAPLITALAPSRGPIAGGNKVIIAGDNLADVSEVRFGEAIAEYAVDSPTQITATAPAGYPGVVQVQVTAPGGVSPDTPSDDYTYSFVPGPPVPALPGFWYRVLELLDEFFSR